MAKASVPAISSKPPKSTVTVIYRPFEGDPAYTRWNGIRFDANVPVELDPKNRDHHVMQLLPITREGTNGETLTKHVEKPVFMGDIARNNPSFEVDGKRARRKVSTRMVPPPGAEWTDAHEGQISDSDEIDTSVAA